MKLFGRNFVRLWNSPYLFFVILAVFCLLALTSLFLEAIRREIRLNQRDMAARYQVLYEKLQTGDRFVRLRDFNRAIEIYESVREVMIALAEHNPSEVQNERYRDAQLVAENRILFARVASKMDALSTAGGD